MNGTKKGFHFRVLHGIILVNTVLIFITGFTILFFTWINTEKTARDLAAARMREILNTVKNKTNNYFEPSERASKEIAYLVYGDFIGGKKSPTATLGFFDELLKVHPEFKMVYFSDTNGNLLMSRRMPDNSISHRSVYNDGTEIRIRWEHENSRYYGEFPNSSSSTDSGYDPRTRLWYQGAVKKMGPAWTPVYIFATDRQPGFTCAVPVYDHEGVLRGVSAVDIAVAELSLFIGTIQPTPGARLFILDDSKNLVAIQAKQQKDLESLFRIEKDKTGNTVYNVNGIADLPESDVREVLARSVAATSESGLLKVGGASYQTLIEPMVTRDGLSLNVGLIIPEDDIIGNVRRNAFVVSVFSVIMILFALGASVFLSRAIADPMRALSEEMGKIKDFVLDSDIVIRTNLYEIEDMQSSFESMRRGLKNFRRYVPADLVAQLINQGQEAGIGGEKRNLTLFFSDIAGFTSISENMAPEKLVADLSVYFDAVSQAILNNGGTVDKYIGDSVMAFWGAPKKIDDHAEKACRSAIQVRNRLQTLFTHWENQGKSGFYTRIGIHTGEAIVGNMGHNERLNYTAIGDTVNIASRLEGMNKIYGTDIMVSQSTHEQVKDFFEFRLLDRAAVLGRKEPFEIYELLSEKDDLSKSLKKIYAFYEAGLGFYFERDWDKAYQHFSAVLKYKPSDKPSQVLRQRCIQYRSAPPDDDWNGAFLQTKK